MKLNPTKVSLRKFPATMRIALLLWSLCMALSLEAQAQNWNFETGDLRNWTPIGTAFSNQPTFGDNVAVRMPGTRAGQVGDYWIGTYENRHTSADPAGDIQGDEPVGQLISPEFDITSPQLTFLIGGGNDINRLRVELLVRIRPGEPLPPPIAALVGIGERVRLPDGEYFLGVFATGRNRESMRREVWDLGVYMGRRARIRIKDNSDGPWGHINVDDFQFLGSSPSMRVHVTNQAGADVKDAEVYVNGLSAGVTDISGNLMLSPLTIDDDIVARKLVLEHQSQRTNHSAGSTQNWDYRIYNTSARVNNDGTITSHAVTNPAVTQELQLSLENTIIGLHLVASVEWDATAGELLAIRDDKIVPASEFLYNATDGQFFIEQFELVDDAALWADADYRIYANWSLRANVTSWMNMTRRNDSRVYIHEFGHYGFDLRDEYADAFGGGLNPNVHCTANVNGTDCTPGNASTNADFGSLQPKASCIMWVQNCTSKLCSHRPENPHAGGTWQLGTSCWTRIADKFRDIERERSFFVRWIIQTPDTRAAIVGTLPNLLSGWRPRVTIDNRSRAGLCQPFEVTVTNGFDGPLLGNAGVWNRTFYDQNILEGNTTGDDTNTPENEAGRLTVTGVHIGDRISSGGTPLLISDCTRARLDGRPSDASFNGIELASLGPVSLGTKPLISMATFDPFVFMQQQQKDVPVLAVTPPPFDLQISFEPTAVAGQALLRARAGAELKSAPQIEFSLVGSTRIQAVEMRFDAATNTYVGVVNQLSSDTQAAVQAIAIDKAGRSVTRNVSVSLSSVAPNVQTDLFSADGQLSLTIPAGALPDGTRVGIGSNAFSTPSLGKGTEILSGPFNVLASTGRSLNKLAILRFQLPTQDGKRSATSMFDPKSFEVLHYNEETKRWEKVGGTLIEAVEIVTLPISELGVYVLTARRPTATTQKFKVTSASLLAAPSKYQGLCPASIKFDGVIETNGQGTVQYTFLRSDGATSPVQTLIFKSAGKLPVSNIWSIGAASLPSYSGWQAIKVLLPTVMESDKANFAIQCISPNPQ